MGRRRFGLAVLALTTVFNAKTVASAKTANKYGTAAVRKQSIKSGAVELGTIIRLTFQKRFGLAVLWE